jgi:hypothetical protein
VLDKARLKALIDAKYGSMAGFAQAMGVSRQYIHAIIRYGDDLLLSQAVEFANRLDVSVDDLVLKASAPARATAFKN